jgi:hypothetical protein
MSEDRIPSTVSEDCHPPWPRGAVAPATYEKPRFIVSLSDFRVQAEGWAFARKFGIGFASALFVFGQGAMNLMELV